MTNNAKEVSSNAKSSVKNFRQMWRTLKQLYMSQKFVELGSDNDDFTDGLNVKKTLSEGNTSKVSVSFRWNAFGSVEWLLRNSYFVSRKMILEDVNSNIMSGEIRTHVSGGQIYHPNCKFYSVYFNAAGARNLTRIWGENGFSKISASSFENCFVVC